MTKSRWQKAASWALVSTVILMTAGCGKEAVVEAPVRAVRTQVLSGTGGTLEREFAADIRARTESKLGFRVGGKVLRRLVELGQSVRAGQVLAELDPQDLRLGQDAARAGVAAAEANAAQAEADLKRFTELRAQGFISAAELDRHVTMAKAAESSLRQAKAQAGVQGNQTAYAALTAPAAGVITAVDVEPGQVVSPGLPVFQLAEDGPRDAVFSVPETLARSVRTLVGRKDAIQVKAWGSDEWVRATIREMAAAADPVSRTFLVKADVGRQGFELGQTASIKLVGPVHAKEGLRVPLQAVAERDGKSVIWVLDGKTMTVQPQPVVTGDITGDVVLIVQGLKPGQEIVTAGAHVLSPGQKVRRYQEPASPDNKS
ncbi:MAG TPA: efflux RND transporter periplasmic adaptor subunit [Aquabacterium sp.]|nr:efflux RND transporter periplasmic adaptor subunit [Aquabacterium sp.]